MFARTSVVAAILVALATMQPKHASAREVVIDDFVERPFSVTAYEDLALGQQLPSGESGEISQRDRVVSIEARTFGDREPTGVTVSVHPSDKTFRFQTGESALGSFGLTYELRYPLFYNPRREPGLDRFRMRFVGDEDTRYLVIQIGYYAGDVLRTAGVRLDARTSTGLAPDAVVEIPFDQFFFDEEINRFESFAVLSGNMRPGLTIEFSQIALASTPMVGDYNRDGVVDLLDFDVWKQSVGARHRDLFSTSSRSLLAVDGNGDGLVDMADYVVWRDAYDAASQLRQAVPEPTAICLGLVAIATNLSRRRTRSTR